MCGSRIRRCVPDPCSRSACVHAGACSDAPAAAGSAAVTTVAAAVVVSVIRISAAGGRTGRRHACVLASWRPLCERCFPQCRQRVFRRVCGIGRCLSALCWLFGHEGVFASVGAALESDEPSVVDGAVDEGGGHVLVAEHASPSAEFDVGGVDDAPCLVGIGNDLEEEPATSRGGPPSRSLRRYR